MSKLLLVSLLFCTLYKVFKNNVDMRLQLETLPTRSDFVETVYNVLVDAIIEGSLAPGERITQEEIAEQLHVSRSPVLQALTSLAL